DGVDQLRDALAGLRGGLENRRDPCAEVGDGEQRLQLRDGGVRAGQVGLVHNEDLRDLHEAGLHRLDLVAATGVRDQDGRAGGRRNLDLVLPGTDRLDDHHVETGRVHHVDHAGRRLRQAAEVAPRCHRAEEHAAIAGEVLHADAVAEDGAVREGRRGVDGDDPDSATALPLLAGQCTDEGGLAGAGGTGDADGMRVAGARVERCLDLAAGRRVRLDERDRAGQCPPVTTDDALDQLRGREGGLLCHHARTGAWDFTNTMMSLVFVPGPKTPWNPISCTLAMSSFGMMPPAKSSTSSTPRCFNSSTTRGNSSRWAPERMESPTTWASSCRAASAIICGVCRMPV